MRASRNSAAACFRWLALWTLFALLLFTQDFVQDLYAKEPFGWQPLLLCWLLQAYCWALLGLLVLWLTRNFPIRKPLSYRFLALHLSCSIGLSLVAVVVICVVGQFFRIPWYLPDLHTVFLPMLVTTGPVSVLSYWVIVALAEAFHRHRLYQQQKDQAFSAELQLADLRAQLAMARLAALQNQLQPHFLFNTLNGIMALVRRNDSTKAEEMLGRLSEFLRAVLRDTEAKEVSLQKELEFLKLYLEIERVRFQDTLHVETEIPPDLLNATVPNLCLQPLVENAIRHGIGRRSSGGTLTIKAQRTNDTLTLEVRDNGDSVAKKSSSESSGIGLANTRARLHNLYGDAGQICVHHSGESETVAVLTMPYRAAELIAENCKAES